MDMGESHITIGLRRETEGHRLTAGQPAEKGKQRQAIVPEIQRRGIEAPACLRPGIAGDPEKGPDDEKTGCADDSILVQPESDEHAHCTGVDRQEQHGVRIPLLPSGHEQ